MAQVPKIYAPTPAQSVAAARGMPVSKIASQNGVIEESASSNATTFDTSFTLQEDQRRDAGNQPSNQQNLPQHGRGRVVVPSREFTTLLEYYSGSNANDDDPDVRARRIGGIVTQAIRTYETNAKVIHGEPDVTGTEISISL